MKKSRALLFLLPVMLFLGAAGAWYLAKETPVPLAPNWRVGQHWRVIAVDRSGKNRKNSLRPWVFRVTGKVSTGGGQTIYTLKAVDVGRRAHYFVIKIRHPDMTLVNVVTYRDGRIVMNEASQGSAFFFNQEGAWSMPLDFSKFPVYALSRKEQTQDLVEEKVIDQGGDGFPVWQRSEFAQKVLPGRIVRLLKLKITADAGGMIVQNYQAWEIGKPWPTDTRRTINGKLVSEAMLVDD